MAKAEPDLVKVNRLVRGDPDADAVGKTIDAEYALSVLRSENARLKEAAKAKAETEARNEETRQKNRVHGIKETLRLQEELLAAQDRICELQGKLLALRAIVNDTTKEQV